MTTQHCRVLAHAQEKDNRTVHAITTDSDAVWSYVYPGDASIPLTRACLLSEVIDFAHVSPGTEVYRWNAQIRQVTHSADLTDFLPQNPPKAFQNHISNNKISSIIALTFDSYFDDLE